MVHHQTEICHDILDFLTLIETHSTVNAIRNTVLEHLFLKCSALEVSAIENSEILELESVALHAQSYLPTHAYSLFPIRSQLTHYQFLSLSILRKDILLNLTTIMLNQTISCLNNTLCRAVVLLKFEELATLILLLKVEDVINIGTSESVDTLGVITNDTYMTMLRSQLPDDLLLCIVSVLILIHEQELEFIGILLLDIRIIIEQTECIDKQIIKVHSIRLSAIHHIHLVYLSHFWHL